MRSLKFARVDEKKHSWVYKHPDWNGGIYIPKEILRELRAKDEPFPAEIWITVSKDQPTEGEK